MDEGMILGNLDLKEGSTRGAIKRTFLRVNSLKLKIHHRRELRKQGTHEPAKDPLHLPSGPITRARAEKFNEVIHMLIQQAKHWSWYSKFLE